MVPATGVAVRPTSDYEMLTGLKLSAFIDYQSV